MEFDLFSLPKMLQRYLNYTIVLGTLRACAIMATAEYCREHKDGLMIDKVGKCVANGVVSPTLWPLFLYSDIRKLEVYLRKKDPTEYNVDYFLCFDYP